MSSGLGARELGDENRNAPAVMQAAEAAMAEAPVGSVPENANQHCPGTESDQAGKAKVRRCLSL